ncbi:transcriptional coactivator ADA2, putative (ADA2), partial [Plasmodium ovale curtisi]
NDASIEGVPEDDIFDSNYHCDICNKDITHTIRIRCADCVDFDLCINCFSSGKEIKSEKCEHYNYHNYIPIPKYDFPLYKLNWSAEEELLLLDGISKYGFGNWEQVADLVNSVAKIPKTNKECESHYYNYYLKSSCAPLPDNKRLLIKPDGSPYDIEHVIEKDINENEDYVQTKNKKNTRTQIIGYWPLRGDFDIEYDNDAELLLADMEFKESDLPQQKELKLQVLEIYNSKLDERIYRKRTVIERGLLDTKSQLQKDKKRTKEEKELYTALKPLSRFLSPQHHEYFIQLLLEEQKLRQRLTKLQEWKTLGLQNIEQVQEYEVEKNRRAKESIKQQQENTENKITKSFKSSKNEYKIKSEELEDNNDKKLNIETFLALDLLNEKEVEFCKDMKLPILFFLLIKRLLIMEVSNTNISMLKDINELKLKGYKVGQLYDFFLSFDLNQKDENLISDITGAGVDDNYDDKYPHFKKGEEKKKRGRPHIDFSSVDGIEKNEMNDHNIGAGTNNQSGNYNNASGYNNKMSNAKNSTHINSIGDDNSQNLEANKISEKNDDSTLNNKDNLNNENSNDLYLSEKNNSTLNDMNEEVEGIGKRGRDKKNKKDEKKNSQLLDTSKNSDVFNGLEQHNSNSQESLSEKKKKSPKKRNSINEIEKVESTKSQNDTEKGNTMNYNSDNNGFEHTIEEGKRKKTNQGSTSNKKSKAPMARKKVRANCEDDPNVNIYEKHYITRRRKKNEPENDGNESKETSNIYTNGIMNIKNKKNVLENNETAKTDTEIVSKLNYSDHISIISNNQDSNHFSLKTSKMISLYDQVDAHDVSENYATNSRKENTDERLLKETIENELIIEKKEVHTKYMEIEEYPNYTKNIFDPTSFTNIDPHFDKNSKHKTRYSSNNICQENNINEKIVEPKMGIIEINNYKNASNIDESEKQIINEKNINGIDTKINLFLDKIEDNKITDSLIKNRIEAEKLNNEIPYITNIYEEMHRSSVMPLRIEAFHSLEDQRLIYGNPDWQKYFCPLCDQKYYPPNVYVKNYIHYLNEHWKNRKNLGGYIIFPCKLEHNNNEMNPSEKKVDVGVTSYNAPKKWKKKKKKMKRNARLFIDPHYHCPLCLHLQFDDYELLVEHCTKLHKSTGADPTRTLPPSFMHTPFINNNDYYCSIKKNETDISSSDILDSDQSDNKIISESKKKGDPLFHDPPSQSDALLELNNLKKNKMKNGRISKVAFCEEIKVREYDIELSKIEKFGASIGPVFTDDKEEPEKVLGSEDSLNPSPLPNELPEQTDVASKPLDHLPISEEPLPECHSNKSVDNSVCCKKLNENKIKECAIPQNNNQIDSTRFDTKTKRNEIKVVNVNAYKEV